MNKFFKSILCLTVLAATLTGQDKNKSTSPASGLPPMIDRELIFGNPEIAAPRFLRMVNTSHSSSRGKTRAIST